MKHLFIVNPISGSGRAYEIVCGRLSSLPKNDLAKTHITVSKGDGERFVREYLSENSEPVRVYACGGDGTLNEVVNGIAAVPGRGNVSLAILPCGSGNDFIKCFGEKEDFLNLAALSNGREIAVDLMKVNDRACINVCHFGFDSYVAAKMNEVRSKKIIGGTNAYTTGVICGLVKAMHNHAVIKADGETLCTGDFLLCTVANGRYVGGKYKCAPQAKVNDGLLDICVAEPVSRLTFVRLVKYYAEGTHLTDPRFKSFLHYKQCKSVTIEAGEGFKISLDGEIVQMSSAAISVLPGAIKLFLYNG